MKPEFSKITFWAAVAAGAVCVLVLAALTFQSLFRLFGPQPEKEKAMPEAKATPTAENARSEVSERTLPGQDVKFVADADEHPSVNANPVPAPKAPASNEFCTDSAKIRQQEHAKSWKKKSLEDFPAQER